ncbi:hypothetical protein JZ751_017279, partial [Albula glossodonta]
MQDMYYASVKALYTVGYSTSLVSLTTAMVILCRFRNFIHMNLFVSFILRAISVFIKDGVLYAEEDSDHCFVHTAFRSELISLLRLTAPHRHHGDPPDASATPLCRASGADPPFAISEWVACKAVMVFFHYCVMSNYFWLFIEGLYLFTLLVETFFPERRYFYWYTIIGWGTPTVCVSIWAVLRLHFDDSGCWDMNDNTALWWVIKGPINFVLFIGIIIILVQKLQSPDIGGNESSIYFCVQKCFCEPTQGDHHPCKMSELSIITLTKAREVWRRICVFTSMKEKGGIEVIVCSCALPLCVHIHTYTPVFQVQSEIKRKWRSWTVNRYFAVDLKHRHPSLASSGVNGGTQLSILSKSSSQVR